MVPIGITQMGEQDHYCYDDHHSKKPSWRCTLVTQLALCLALYGAFSLGRPQRSGSGHRLLGRRSSLDLYFLSVRGGVWPEKEQNQLLHKMEMAAKIYKAEFVVNIGELGENDPLQRNATLHLPLSNIPWYTTTVSHGQLSGNFIKRIEISHEQILDIIGMDTGPFQQMTSTVSNQLDWLRTTLATSDSNWRIVVGFDPLVDCKDSESADTAQFYEPLHHIFLKYGVNAYIGEGSCAGYHHLIGGLAYIGNPGHSHINRSHDVISELQIGFFLHRVTPLEMESYFINMEEKIVSKSTIHQAGRSSI